MIDEAFNRGSELSTRYALDLFTRLGLQLLIVTPLQKIHVIEPHVRGRFRRQPERQLLTAPVPYHRRAPHSTGGARTRSTRMSTTPSWTIPDELVATLRRRWASGRYLRAHARGAPWETVSLPVRGPTADDVLRDSAAVVAWMDTLRHAATDRRGRACFTIECRTVRNRVLGENLVPARIHIGSLEQLAELLGVVHEIERLDAVLAATRRVLPGAEAWVADHPSEALAHCDAWPRLLATARWIVDHDRSTLDLRHLDVPDVDTKFVERNRKILGRLLDESCPSTGSTRPPTTSPGGTVSDRGRDTSGFGFSHLSPAYQQS